MSRIFWRHGDNYMAKALIGMRMYTNMGEQFSNMDQEALDEHINDYSELAMDILRRSYKSNENDSSQMIVSSLSCCSTHSVLGLAVLAEHEEFIAHSSSQTVLNEIWSGGIRQCDNINMKVQ
ncbi:transient receptor potential cation channel subfamily M member 1-like [Convolutriloba macropyga]|uniref:transient receptor potential cation channel subfamily M member 1-like n=1 Tax=Convolutriloba macropyga TaxID=536237 RepID=UPI003F522B7B